jgi:hypothetical protein
VPDQTVSPGAEKIVRVLVMRAVGRCHREGIPLEEFFAAMRAEGEAGRRDTVRGYIRRVFARVMVRYN